jgi:phosphatidylglycerophosphate synthase
VDQFLVIAPVLIPLAYMIAMLVIYIARCALGNTPDVHGLERRSFTEIIGPHLTRYFLWLIRPVEKLFVAARISPNALTGASLLLCATSGVSIATGHLAAGTWTYVLAGMLDVLDGRLARATGQQSQAGAFLDSVADRWGELFVFSGFAWYLRDTPWLGAVMLAVAGSMMVSYTRARGEGLTVQLSGGTMQRAERIFIVSLGTLIAAWFAAAGDESGYGTYAIGVGATGTSLGRWVNGYRALKRREDPPAPVAIQKPRAQATPADTRKSGAEAA